MSLAQGASLLGVIGSRIHLQSIIISSLVTSLQIGIIFVRRYLAREVVELEKKAPLLGRTRHRIKCTGQLFPCRVAWVAGSAVPVLLQDQPAALLRLPERWCGCCSQQLLGRLAAHMGLASWLGKPPLSCPPARLPARVPARATAFHLFPRVVLSLSFALPTHLHTSTVNLWRYSIRASSVCTRRWSHRARTCLPVHSVDGYTV